MPDKSPNEVSQQARDYYEKGSLGFQRNNFDNGVHFLEECLKLEPGFLKARQLLRAQEIKKAKSAGGISKLFKSVASSPKSLFGGLTKDPKKALESAEEALVDSPFNVQANRLIATSCEQLDLPLTAVFAMETALEGHPDDISVMMDLGRLYTWAGQPEKSRDIYERILKLEPSNSAAFKGLHDATANTAVKAGNWENAESYRDLLKNETEAKNLEAAGKIFKDEDILQQQMDEVYKQTQEMPENRALWKKLGDLAVQKNEFDYAISVYQHAYDLSQKADANLERLIVEARIKKIKFQVEKEEEKLQANPAANGEITGKIAEFKAEMGKIRLEELESRAKRYPNDLDIRFDLGVVYFKNKQFDKAIQELQLASNNPKNKISCTYYLGCCFREKGILDLAIMRFKSALEQCLIMDGLKKDILYDLGQTFEQKGKKEDAIEQYKLIYDADVTYRDISQKIEEYYKGLSGNASAAA